MQFLASLDKDLKKAGLDVGKIPTPTFWVSTGNYAQNKVISGSFLRGVPQGRITAFAGPSGAGKSFNVANLIAEAQKRDMIVIVLDSESALDTDFVSKLGVNTDDERYMYVPVSTIAECKKTVSLFIKNFKNEHDMEDPDTPEVLLVIDSLNMLMTDNEQDQFEKGLNKGDQGQKNKQLKSMLQSFTNNIKNTPIVITVTSQVYANQDITNGKGAWIVPDAVQYCCSQIVLLTKLSLKNDDDPRKISGIRMKCMGFKTRFAKPFESVTIEVPYNKGMNPYDGLLDIAVESGIVKKAGSWFTFTEKDKDEPTKFQRKKFDSVAQKILDLCEEKSATLILKAIMPEDAIEDRGDGVTSKTKRREKFNADREANRVTDDSNG